MSDFSTDQRIKKSRKPHQCDECQRTIPTGSEYKRYAGVWEGEFYEFVSCLQCEDLRKLINRFDGYFWEQALGGVGEWFAQGTIREVNMTFVQALQLERLRRQFERQWV